MKAYIGDSIESPVVQVTSKEADKKLYELSVRMKQLATNIKTGYDINNVVHVVDNAGDLADTVMEFLKVSGWDRP